MTTIAVARATNRGLFIVNSRGELVASNHPQDLGYTPSQRDVPELATLDALTLTIA